MSDPNDSTSQATTNTGDGVPLSSTFLEFCAKVRDDDPSILPDLGNSFQIQQLSEREYMELADALLHNTSITYLELFTDYYTKSSAEALAKYVRTSKHLQRIHWPTYGMKREETLCCFLPAIQEGTSLKELQMGLPPIAVGHAAWRSKIC
jgi:hypothetical protein